MNSSTSSVLTSHDLESCGKYNHDRMKMNNPHVNIAVQPLSLSLSLLFFHITPSFFPFNCILHSLSVKEGQYSVAANQPAVIRFQQAMSIFNNMRDNLMQMSSLWCCDYQWERRQSTKMLSGQQEANSEDWEASRDFISVSANALESEWGKCLAFGKNACPDHGIPDISLFPDGGGRKWWKRRQMRNRLGCLFFPNGSNIRTAIRNRG